MHLPLYIWGGELKKIFFFGNGVRVSGMKVFLEVHHRCLGVRIQLVATVLGMVWGSYTGVINRGVSKRYPVVGVSVGLAC